MVVAEQLFSRTNHPALCDGATEFPIGSSLDNRTWTFDSVRCVCCLWSRFAVQPNDLSGCNQHLAWAKSEPIRLLVLHHQLLSLSNGDLSNGVGDPALVCVYFYCSGLGRGQRAGSIASSTPCASAGLGMGFGRVCAFGVDCVRVFEPMGVPTSLEKLCQRQQLAIPHGLLVAERYLLSERQIQKPALGASNCRSS